MEILLIPLALLSFKAMVYSYEIISLTLDKVHEKIIDKIEKM